MSVSAMVESIVEQTVQEGRATLTNDAFREMLLGLATRFGFEAMEADLANDPTGPCNCEACRDGQPPPF